MTHTAPTPHDAEEQLRPLLGALFDAEEEYIATQKTDQLAAYRDAALAALHTALALLGVRQ